LSLVNREAGIITIAVPFQTSRVIALMLSVSQCLGFGRSQAGIVTRVLTVAARRQVALMFGVGCLFRLLWSEFRTVAFIPAIHAILRAAKMVRRRILSKHGSDVLPDCYTGHCTCDFLDSLRHSMPASVNETAIYSEGDGVVDWRYCKTDRSDADFRVSGTHIGLVFNPSAYSVIAKRLAQTGFEGTERNRETENS